MRSDYIVPEASPSRRKKAPQRVLMFGAAVGLAIAAAGQWDTDNQPVASAPADTTGEIALVASAASPSLPPRAHGSFLSDLAPLGEAHASVHAPLTAESLIDATEAADEQAAGKPGSIDVDTGTAEEDIAADVAPAAAPPSFRTALVTVRSGDSLSSVFSRENFPTTDWIALSRLKGDAKRLQNMQPGDEIKLIANDDEQLIGVELALDDLRTLKISRLDDGSFTQTIETLAFDTREARAEGTIENSLFLTAKDAGLSDRLTMELTDIFAWDIDFAMDIRSGDSFRVIYEEVMRDGEKLKDGKILAAEFVNQGKVMKALRYTDSDGRSGYYSPDGAPMQKAFLRSPVDFSRISSRFSMGRKHPILNKIRAHKGVDYAAARGTPVKSAGNGKVVFAGVKGGYGNVLIVQHAGKYKTLYAHLKSFRNGIRRGVSVDQGQVIGYVGSSGLATGPHLHYEFLVNDHHVNPLTVKLPTAPKITGSELARFKDQTAALLAALETDTTSTELADAR